MTQREREQLLLGTSNLSLSLSTQAQERTHHDAYVCTAIGELSQKENVFVLVNIALLLLLYICFPYYLYCSAQ